MHDNVLGVWFYESEVVQKLATLDLLCGLGVMRAVFAVTAGATFLCLPHTSVMTPICFVFSMALVVVQGSRKDPREGHYVC